MRGNRTPLAVVGLLAAGLVAPAAADAATVLKSRMTGAQVVNPAGGSARGVAYATLRANANRDRICFEVTYEGLGGRATAGHLRRGQAGEMSRPVVTLFQGAAPSPVSGCVRGLETRDVRRLARNPGGHYVDLTTRRHPKGAVRGQLRPETKSEQGGGLPGPGSGGLAPNRR